MRRTKTVSICLEFADHDLVKAYAKENYMSVSQIITKLIRENLTVEKQVEDNYATETNQSE